MRRYTDRCTGAEYVDYGMGFVPAAGVGAMFEASEFVPVMPAPPKQYPPFVLPPFCGPGYVADGNRCVPTPPTSPTGLQPEDVCSTWRRPSMQRLVFAVQGAVVYHGDETTARAIDSVRQGGELTVSYFPDKDYVVSTLRSLPSIPQSPWSSYGQSLVFCAKVLSGEKFKLSNPFATGNGSQVTATTAFVPTPPCPAGYTWGGSSCVPLPPTR